jgi:hypothetical protein
MIFIEQLIELAKEIEHEDPIDWGTLNIDEDQAFKLLAPSVLENYMSIDEDNRDVMMLSTILKLTVENFVLNVKLLRSEPSSSKKH